MFPTAAVNAVLLKERNKTLWVSHLQDNPSSTSKRRRGCPFAASVKHLCLDCYITAALSALLSSTQSQTFRLIAQHVGDPGVEIGQKSLIVGMWLKGFAQALFGVALQRLKCSR